MQLSDFNHASPQLIRQRLMQCVHIERWAKDIEQQRPFRSKQSLLDYAELRAQTWTWQEILSALATHPRIGEKQAKQVLSAKEQKFSDHEQANISQDQSTQHALLQGNMAYEKKFNFIFLIRAAGRSSQDILAILKQRLNHDLNIEKQIVHQQLSEIALLRMTQEIQA